MKKVLLLFFFLPSWVGLFPSQWNLLTNNYKLITIN